MAFRVATYSYFGYPLSFVERLNVIVEAGFAVTSIGLGPEEELVRSGVPDLMPALARERGLFVEYVHAPEGRCNLLWSESERLRKEGRDDLSASIAYCAKHSIPVVVAHITKGKGEQPPPANRAGLDTLIGLAAEALDSHVVMAIENTQKPEYLDYLFSRVSSPALGFCYDSSHDFLYSPEPGRLLKDWGHLLTATHISDNDRTADRHWLPGEGAIDWGLVKKVFPCGTYRGSLNLEIFPRDPARESPLAFLVKARERIEGLARVLNP